MPDFCHLVCVTQANNNKYYDMQDLGNGEFEVTYGRIGATATKKIYPMSRWYSLYNQKIGKGYKDQTNLVAVKTIQNNERYKPIEDAEISNLIDYLREKARDTVAKNYTVASTQVSASMVAKAQNIINRLYNVSGTASVEDFNEDLIELFGVIPRKMNSVPEHLAESRADFDKIIHREQQLLDVMAGQVSGNVVEQKNTGNEGETILEAFGLEFSPVTDKDIAIIKKELGPECAHMYYKAWRVENKTTRKNFKEFCKGKGRLAKKLLWHGSRTENWWGILRSGLVLRPTNAVINGKMFGYGLYFAPKARKSVRYTSLRGSTYAHGSSSFGFLSLYEVAYGKPYDVSDNYGCGDMTWNKLQKVAPGCTSLHAHAGRVLMNDEIIVYREDQTTIKYLVELKN
jgi:poly [ADP-ribose] polymerase